MCAAGCANAWLQVPGVNASWQRDFIRQYGNVDISVAVQTPVGLLTPIVKDAHTKGLAAISADVKALAKKVTECACGGMACVCVLLCISGDWLFEVALHCGLRTSCIPYL